MDLITLQLLTHYYYKRFILKCKLEDCNNIKIPKSFDIVKAKMELEKELKETEIRIKMITMEKDFNEL